LLGVVTEDGAFVPVGGLGEDDFQRTDNTDNRGGKGVKNATEITGMFEFDGQVCYIYADDPACTSGTACAATDYCCPIDDTTLEFNGACELKETVKFWDGANYTCSFADGNPADTLWVDETFYCRDYTDAFFCEMATRTPTCCHKYSSCKFPSSSYCSSRVFLGEGYNKA
jgi:hypothetical protein